MGFISRSVGAKFCIAIAFALCMAGLAQAVPAAASAPALSPASQATAPVSAMLRFEAVPGGVSSADFQGLGNLHVPEKKVAVARSDRPILWHAKNSRYRSALLFDESGGTGTGYDTLYVSYDGDESFGGKVASYKPSETDVSPDAPGRSFAMTFEDVTVGITRDRPDIKARVTFHGSRDQDDPDSQFRFSGRLYPPQPKNRWAVGETTIEGEPVMIGLLDEDKDGQFTCLSKVSLEGWPNSYRGDLLLVGYNPEKFDPNRSSQYGDSGPVRVPLVKHLVLNSGTYRIDLKPAEDGIKLRLVPVEPAGGYGRVQREHARRSSGLAR